MADPDRLAADLAGPAEEVRVTLDECVRAALTKNPVVALAGISRAAAADSLEGARADRLYPSLSASTSFGTSSTRASEETEGVDVVTRSTFPYALGVSEAIPGGGSFYVGYSGTRATTNSENAVLPTSHTGYLTLSVTQPLLKGFGLHIAARDVRLAEFTLALEDEALRDALNAVIAEVASAYWELVLARADARIKRSALKNLEERLAFTERAIAEGRAARSDIHQVEAQLATSVESYLASVNSLLAAEEKLKRLTRLPAGRGGKRVRPLPTDEPPAVAGEAPALEDSLKRARERSPSIRYARISVDMAAFSYKLARRDTWPSLSFGGSLTFTGYGEDPSAETKDLFDPATSYWSIGLSLSVPLGPSSARATARIRGREVGRSRIYLEDADRRLAESLDAAVRRIRLARTGIELSVRRRELSERTLKAEEEKFSLGRSTLKDLLDFQVATESARAAEASARIEYAKAVIDLSRLEGVLADDAGVRFKRE